MRNILCLILAVGMIAASVAFGVYLGFPLTLAFLLFLYCAVKNGHSKQEVAGFARQGLKKALIVVKVLLLISLCTALFFASGSTASLIHYALLLIRPKLFLLLCFVIASGFSMLQGSAFAAASTGGVVLYIIGCTGGVPPAMIVGAILSGIYVGDRASPVSSSLALASAVTDVPHKRAFALMLKTGLLPYLLALLFYLPFSLANPLSGAMAGLSADLVATYRIDLIAVLPVAVLLTLCICRVSASWSLLFSAITALFVAVFHQGADLAALLSALLTGYTLPEGHALAGIMQGGGLLPMIKSMYVVAVSCSLAVVLEEGGLIGDHIPSCLAKGKKPLSLLLRMWAVSIPGAMLGCNQTMALVLTGQLMRKPYENAGLSNEKMMTDLSLTATLLSPLIPWTLAFTLPLSALQYSSLACLPFAAFLWIGPVYHLCKCYLLRNKDMPPARLSSL